MVHLTKIYTKTGDNGTTSLADNTRVNKNSIIMDAIGAVDEANSAIGMIQGYNLDQYQNDLFDLGAELAGAKTVNITEERIKNIENQIDTINKELPALQSFILPKGEIHNARAIVRRAEREVWKVGLEINPFIPKYLNRLSDYLFVLARFDSGRLSETLWRPMGHDEI
jgi:cob(I)alamin adenosyltransferase